MRTANAPARPVRPVLRTLPAALAAVALTAVSAATVALGVHGVTVDDPEAALAWFRERGLVGPRPQVLVSAAGPPAPVRS